MASAVGHGLRQGAADGAHRVHDQLFATATFDRPRPVRPTSSPRVIESAGTPVQNGTVVTFTTTLGRIEPVEARTQNGKVTVKLTGDGRSGTATITAFSGGAISEQLELPIGSAAAETVTVRAEPGRLPPGGGSTQIVALVRDVAGNALSGASVAFTASAGNLSSGVAVTDANGEARTTLTTGARDHGHRGGRVPRRPRSRVSVDGALGLTVTVVTRPAGRRAQRDVRDCRHRADRRQSGAAASRSTSATASRDS